MSSENLIPEEKNNIILESIQTMCRIFWGPDIESCTHLMEPTFFKQLETLFSMKGKAVPNALEKMQSITKKFKKEQSFFDHLNECYVRLFVNNKEGIIPLYQSCYEYENAPMMGKAAQNMTRRFESKGLCVENAIKEPPDHLAIELEFLFFLLSDTSSQGESALFVSETLLPWVGVINKRLESVSDECRFYSYAAKVLIHILELLSKDE